MMLPRIDVWKIESVETAVLGGMMLTAGGLKTLKAGWGAIGDGLDGSDMPIRLAAALSFKMVILVGCEGRGFC